MSHTFEVARTSAPRATSRRTASGWPAAHIRAVWPNFFSRAFTRAPRSSSIFITSICPRRAAVINGVSPSSRATFGSAPFPSRSWTIAGEPFAIARDRGPMPCSLVRFGFAPAFSSSAAISILQRTAAQASAVAPSSSRAFTSTCLPKSTDTAARSSFCTASMSDMPDPVIAGGAARKGTVRTHAAASRQGTTMRVQAPCTALYLQAVQFAGAVTQLLGRHPDLIEHSEIKIGQRGGIARIDDVTSARDAPGCAACHNNRQIVLAVNGGHAQIAAIHDQGMIEQCRISFFELLQFGQEVSEEFRLVHIDLGKSGEFVRLEIVM